MAKNRNIILKLYCTSPSIFINISRW